MNGAKSTTHNGRRSAGSSRTLPRAEFAGFGAKAPLSATQRATANPYGITLDRVWTDWAAQHGVSETIAAALCLISRNRRVGEVVVKLTPGEVERVIDIVQRWPDHFPSGALVALKNSRPTSSLERSAACGSPDA
jgi:hypothetical protein